MRYLLPLIALVACGAPPPPPPPDGGCTATTTAYPDADGDGFGSANDSPLVVCAGQVPIGYTTANHLDCGDGDSRANPAAGPMYRTTPITGASPNPWDFNCDGTVTMQYPVAPRLCFGTSGCAAANNGWQGDPNQGPPGCGVTATWITDCRFSVSQCVAAGTTQRTQGCF